MTTRRTALLLTLGLPASFLNFPAWAFSKEFWNDKKPEDWSPDEVELLLNKSPWAKEVTATMNVNGNAPAGSRRGGGMGGMGGGGMGGMGGGSRRGGGGSTSSSTPGSAPKTGGLMKGVVVWESALPILQARKKEAPPEAAEFHILSVDGVPMIGGRKRSSTGAETSDSPDEIAQMEERVRDGTLLTPHGKDPVSPAKVALSQSERPTLIYFRRDAEPLVLDRKEVAFQIKLGAMEVKTKFILKEMTSHGKLEL
jgi:hypothetical protein